MMIQALKLTTGQDIVADTKYSDGTFYLTNPAYLMLNERGTYMIVPGFAPLAKKDGNNITITMKPEHVLCHYEIDDHSANVYNEIFGGITVAKKPNLLLPE